MPCPPPLTALLHQHMEKFGTAADGRLFRNLTGGDLAESTIARVWDRARKTALSKAEYESVLARRPYDLRHACVSTWLAPGCRPHRSRSGPATQWPCCIRSTPRS